MSKGLEALERIKEFYPVWRLSNREDFNTIEKELNRLEELKIMYSNCVIEGTKQKKALEIIKKYANKDGVHIDFNKVMRATIKNFDYTTMTYIVDEELIKEYDLLKEVLL